MRFLGKQAVRPYTALLFGCRVDAPEACGLYTMSSVGFYQYNRVRSAKLSFVIILSCYSLLGKLIFASDNLALQMTPKPPISPKFESHSKQDVEQTRGRLLLYGQLVSFSIYSFLSLIKMLISFANVRSCLLSISILSQWSRICCISLSVCFAGSSSLRFSIPRN